MPHTRVEDVQSQKCVNLPCLRRWHGMLRSVISASLQVQRMPVADSCVLYFSSCNAPCMSTKDTHGTTNHPSQQKLRPTSSEVTHKLYVSNHCTTSDEVTSKSKRTYNSHKLNSPLSNNGLFQSQSPQQQTVVFWVTKQTWTTELEWRRRKVKNVHLKRVCVSWPTYFTIQNYTKNIKLLPTVLLQLSTLSQIKLIY